MIFFNMRKLATTKRGILYHFFLIFFLQQYTFVDQNSVGFAYILPKLKKYISYMPPLLSTNWKNEEMPEARLNIYFTNWKDGRKATG